MSRAILITLLLYFNSLHAQVFPAENSNLNFRLVGFSFSGLPGSHKTEVQVAKGWYQSEDSFRKHLVCSGHATAGKVILEVPDFGQQYTWRVVTGGQSKNDGRFYHFTTGTNPLVDTSLQRLEILKQSDRYKDMYIFVDAHKVLYDRRGRAVWYLPSPGPRVNDNFENEPITDLKISTAGTITYIQKDKQIYEIDYAGKVLWSGPLNDSVNREIHYHHEFTRQPDGHYMVLGTEPVYLSEQGEANGGGTYNFSYRPDLTKKVFGMGVLNEYDKGGKLVWQWRFADYFPVSGLNNTSVNLGRYTFDAHSNSFYFDRDKNCIYMSFRNVGRILKVAYPSGKVLNTYVGKFDVAGAGESTPNLFAGQHSCGLTSDGLLYLYNNAIDDTASKTNVLFLKEGGDGTNAFTVVWDYPCDISDVDMTSEMANGFTRGGNVIELGDKNIFISMCSPYSKLMIVTRDKKMVWSALPQTFNKYTGKWQKAEQYRASLITNRLELERLIWQSER